MALLPDSGDPGDVHDQLGLGTQKPDLLTDATWADLSERFQLRGEKGRGGQAVVFEAKERNAPYRRVAIKVYHENTQAAQQAFDNECRFLASDRLPAEVVGYYQCVAETDADRQPYLVLEFIDGTTLGKLATMSRRKLKFNEKVELVERLAKSLHRLHSCNLVFGDASANNILIEPDFGIRFVDLAGAKELMKGHGRSRSSINLVTPGFFAQTETDSAALAEVRTNLASDLYALAANAFLLLTGRTEDQCRSGGSRSADTEWHQALSQARVPRGLRMVVVKGLRVPDPLKSNDPRLYATAEAFANDIAVWQTRQRQRRAALVFGLPALLCVCLLVVVALIGWQKYAAEQSAFDVRRLAGLQDRVQRLPNASQPAITALIAQVDALQKQREQQVAKQQTGQAAATLRQMTQKLEQALNTSAALEPCLELRTALATELISDPKDAIIAWLVENPHIQSGLKQLVRDNGQIKSQLDAGDTRSAYAALVVLQKDILQLKRGNDRALVVKQIRQRYDALHDSVPERLMTDSEFTTIDQFAQGGIVDWNQGSWDASERGLGQAIQRLNQWLEPKLTAEERSARVAQLQADREAALRVEVARISSERDTARGERDGLQTSLAALNEKLKQKDSEIETQDE